MTFFDKCKGKEYILCILSFVLNRLRSLSEYCSISACLELQSEIDQGWFLAVADLLTNSFLYTFTILQKNKYNEV